MATSQKPDIPRPWLPQRLLGRAGSRAFWMLSDQAVVSIGNFLTANLLARYLLPVSQFGAYGIILETLLFFNSLQAALVNYPLTIQAAGGGQRGLRKAATAAMYFTLLMLPVLGAAMWAAAGWTAGARVGAVAMAAMLLWQMQETLRRGLIAEFRIAASIPGDVISYLGQAGIVFVLHKTGHLNLLTAFGAVAGTSAAAMALQAWQIGLAPIDRADCRALAIEWWRLGRWMLLTNLTTVVTGISFWWVLNFFWHLQAVAIFTAITQPLKLSNPVLSSVGGLIVPAVARSAAGGGTKAATRSALRYAALGAAILLPMYAFLFVFPGFSLRVFYGPGSPYLQHAPLLRIWSITWVVGYFTMVAGSWLAGLKQSRYHFIAQAIHTGAAVCISLPTTAIFGLKGLLWGGLFTGSVNLTLLVYLLGRAIRHGAPGGPATDGHGFEVILPDAEGQAMEMPIQSEAQLRDE